MEVGENEGVREVRESNCERSGGKGGDRTGQMRVWKVWKMRRWEVG